MTYLADQLSRSREVVFNFANHRIKPYLEHWPDKRFGIDEFSSEINRFVRNAKNFESFRRHFGFQTETMNVRIQELLRHVRSIQAQLDAKLDQFIEMTRKRSAPKAPSPKRSKVSTSASSGPKPATKSKKAKPKIRSPKKGRKRTSKARPKTIPKVASKTL